MYSTGYLSFNVKIQKSTFTGSMLTPFIYQRSEKDLMHLCVKCEKQKQTSTQTNVS